MASRALIVAVESYPHAKADLATSMPGTLNSAIAFRAWVEERWTAEGLGAADRQMLFCSEPPRPGGRGASRLDIIDAIEQLKCDGQGTTDELFFFFSGHGFCYVERPDKRVDVVIASDYVRAAVSGPSCFMLDEIVSCLRAHLGPGRQYYFVDACRNPLTSGDIRVGPQLTWDPHASGEASTFVLQSTEAGSVAVVGGPFPDELLAGLRGKGRAKVWIDGVNDAMHVRYDSLRKYLKGKLTTQKIYSRVEGTEGESEGLLAVLRPVPLSQCTIKIETAPPVLLNGTLELKGERSGVQPRAAINAVQTKIPLSPDIYSIALQLEGATIVPSGPVAVDLYDDASVAFRATGPRSGGGNGGGGGTPGGPGGGPGHLQISMPKQTAVNVRNVNTDERTVFKGSVRVALPQGDYFAEAVSPDNKVFKRMEFEMLDGQLTSLDVADWGASAPHGAIARHLPSSPDGIDFSESLGDRVSDPDLDLWLALLGGGRILGSTGDYSKIAKFPVHDFSREPPSASPIYVLAGLADANTDLLVGVSHDAKVRWTKAKEPPSMPGIREAYFKVPPGSYLVSIALAGQAPYTVASHATPNRAMLVTLSYDDDQMPRIAQYLLPIGHLVPGLDPQVQQRLSYRNHLKDVRFLAQASRAFRRRRDLAKALGREELDELLWAKWLDPIASSLAAYEYIRRGRKKEIGEVVNNMQRFFADLPDTESIAKLAGQQVGAPKAPPLFSDGLRAFPDFAKGLPLPAGHLDFTSPWTAWLAAVKT